MMNGCRRDASWFVAAATNDIEFIRQKLNKQVKTRDFRSTSIQQGIIKGFTALHYACYNGCLEIVKLLLDQEIGLLTQEEAVIPTPGFSNFAKYKLPSGSTCLSIALLRGKDEIVRIIVQWLEAHKSRRGEVIGKLDDQGLCTYLMASLCTFAEAENLLQNPIFVDSELFLVKQGDMTAVMNAAYFGRPQLANILYNFSTNEKYKEEMYHLVLKRDSNECTCLDLCDIQIDNTKYGCTNHDRTKCKQILSKLCKEALNYAQQHNWAEDVHVFLLGMSEQKVFGHEIILKNNPEQPKKNYVEYSSTSSTTTTSDSDHEEQTKKQ